VRDRLRLVHVEERCGIVRSVRRPRSQYCVILASVQAVRPRCAAGAAPGPRLRVPHAQMRRKQPEKRSQRPQTRLDWFRRFRDGPQEHATLVSVRSLRRDPTPHCAEGARLSSALSSPLSSARRRVLALLAVALSSARRSLDAATGSSTILHAVRWVAIPAPAAAVSCQSTGWCGGSA
jgi:hypothetical protein